MNFEEFMKIVKVLKSAYTSDNFLPDADAVKVWYHSLKDIPYQLLQVASYQYITTHKFPPTISELRETSAKATSEDTNWSVGWKQVLGAISKHGIYNEQSALADMDAITQTAVERIGFRNICLSENIAVERANFRIIYEQLETQQRESELIPVSVKAKIEELSVLRLTEREATT